VPAPSSLLWDSSPEELAEQGFVAEVNLDGERRYEARSATRRGRQLPQQIWQALGVESDSLSNTEASRSSQTVGISGSLRELVSSKYGSFFLRAGPVVAAFLLAKCLLLTSSGSFAGLLSLIGAIVVPLLGGIFPVLLLVASRRKGEPVGGRDGHRNDHRRGSQWSLCAASDHRAAGGSGRG
jgi:hypothetical protein